MMKTRIFYFVCIVFLATACKKRDIFPMPQPVDPSTPEMIYQDLNNKTVKYGQADVSIDLNQDGKKDIWFGTLLVGDHILKLDRVQFLAYTNIYTRLAVNINEHTPRFSNGDVIPIENFNGYEWWGFTELNLVEKVIPDLNPFFWRGTWFDVKRKYIGVQVTVNNQPYNGWVEISHDPVTETVVLHKSAVCKIPQTAVKAGQ